MTKIIGLLGPAGVGKSTVAKYLEDRYGARRYSFAGPLKEIARRTLDFSEAQLYGTQDEKETDDPRYGFSPRWFLQRLGTEGCRGVLGADFWIRTCLRHIERDSPAIAVVEDVRFGNEAAAIRRWTGSSDPDAGYVWRLRPPGDGEAVTRMISAGSHASELQWLDADADLEIAPENRGLLLLHALVDDAALSLSLQPKVSI